VYTLPYYWKYDYRETYKALHAKYFSDSKITDVTLKAIYNNYSCISVKKGEYPVLVEYVLPGTNIVTSSKKVVLINSFSDF
jgi:hypothetical protein